MNLPDDDVRAQIDVDSYSVVCYKNINNGRLCFVRVRQKPICVACNLMCNTLSSYYKHILDSRHRQNVKKMCNDNCFIPSVYDQAIHLVLHNDSEKFRFVYKQKESCQQSISDNEKIDTSNGRQHPTLEVTLIFQDKTYVRNGTGVAQLREQLLQDMLADRVGDLAALPIEIYYIDRMEVDDELDQPLSISISYSSSQDTSVENNVTTTTERSDVSFTRELPQSRAQLTHIDTRCSSLSPTFLNQIDSQPTTIALLQQEQEQTMASSLSPQQYSSKLGDVEIEASDSSSLYSCHPKHIPATQSSIVRHEPMATASNTTLFKTKSNNDMEPSTHKTFSPSNNDESSIPTEEESTLQKAIDFFQIFNKYNDGKASPLINCLVLTGLVKKDDVLICHLPNAKPVDVYVESPSSSDNIYCLVYRDRNTGLPLVYNANARKFIVRLGNHFKIDINYLNNSWQYFFLRESYCARRHLHSIFYAREFELTRLIIMTLRSIAQIWRIHRNYDFDRHKLFFLCCSTSDLNELLATQSDQLNDDQRQLLESGLVKIEKKENNEIDNNDRQRQSGGATMSAQIGPGVGIWKYICLEGKCRTIAGKRHSIRSILQGK